MSLRTGIDLLDNTLKMHKPKNEKYFLDYIKDFGPRKNITEKSKISGRLGVGELQHPKSTVNLYLEYI